MKYSPLLFLMLAGCATEPHSGQDCADQGSTNAHFGIIGLAASIHCYGTADESSSRPAASYRPAASGTIESKDYAEPEALCAQGLDAYCEAKEASRRNTALDPKPRDAKLCAEGYKSYC